MDLNQRLPRLDTSRFAMIPRSQVPRSTFVTTHSYKTTFDFDFLIPFHVDECLPGDVHQGQLTIFARLATPVFPIMDSIELETFFFFVPARLLWANWVRFQGQRDNPGDSISYTVPQNTSPAGGFGVRSVEDYYGIPTAGQITGANVLSVNTLPMRAYRFIWNEWFRDQNLQNASGWSTGDGPDVGDFGLLKRNKKADYFTSALPWPMKGGGDVTSPLTGLAAVKGIAIGASAAITGTGGVTGQETGGTSSTSWTNYYQSSLIGTQLFFRSAGGSTGSAPQIYADLSTATGMTINALRLAMATQALLERDARGGTRYTEMLRARWGVEPQDSRLQRPEYIGGGRTYFQTQAIPYTASDRNSSTQALNAPVGQLGAAATVNDSHSFTCQAQEHGYIIGLVCVRGEISYQQGLDRMWTRSTRYDFYMPEFAYLGEQAVRLDEIYAQGTSADTTVFGYQERWAEYRYRRSKITSQFRSTVSLPLDSWHLSERFATAPALNSTFIAANTPASRVISAGTNANGQQVLFDSVFKIKSTRPLPMYSVPGNVGRF